MNEADQPLASSGVSGLDDILGGGLAPDRLYLIEGAPGAGKTTLAMQFLLAGARLGERVLYVTLSETEQELRAVADSHGWALEGVEIREMLPTTMLNPSEQYTMYHPSEVELADTVQRILAHVEAQRPSRVVFDSLSELRMLAGDPLRYRRQILALKHFFAGRRCTTLLLDEKGPQEGSVPVQSIAHGVVSLQQATPLYGGQRRRMEVVKHRGRTFRSGHHDYRIVRGGLEVFPRLIAAEHRARPAEGWLSSGVPALDALMGGGLKRGTSMLVVGAAGTGKSTLAALFAASAAGRGERAALFLFEESASTLLERTDGLDIDLRMHVDAGRVAVREIDPAELSPGEFAQAIRGAAESGAQFVVIDSLNGYLHSMPDESYLVAQLHEILSFLRQQGVASALINAQQGIIGLNMSSQFDASYLADSVLMLRYYEIDGEVRQAISMVKKRTGVHERTLRDLRFDGGIKLGEPLQNFRGVLTGVPRKVGE